MAKGYVVTYGRKANKKHNFAEKRENAEKIAQQYRALGYRHVAITPVD